MWIDEGTERDLPQGYEEAVHRTVRHVVASARPRASQEDENEMVQDALAEAFRRGKPLILDARKPWPLLGLVRHAARRLWLWQARSRTDGQTESPESRTQTDRNATPEETARYEELLATLERSVLPKLPPAQAVVFRAVVMNGQTVHEVVVQTGWSGAAVRSLLQRSRETVKRLLQRLGFHP